MTRARRTDTTHSPSDLEATFDTLWHALAAEMPALVPEYRFDPRRRWRLDRAAPDALVGVELDGGIWTAGRHTRGAGYSRDCEKLNAAAAAGWAVFRLTADMLADDPARHIGQIADAIAARRRERAA